MNRAIAKGAVWMVLFKLAERSLTMVSVLVLARLLVPADFGIVAMAMSVIAFVELAGAFSFEIALIQRERPTRAHYDTTWTLQILFGSGCAAAIAALAYPTALFYGDPRLQLTMLALAAGTLIQSVENVGVVDFRRAMDFSREFAFLASKKVAGFLVTISLAVFLQSYWALIAGTLAVRLTGVVLSYGMQPYRPRFSLAARAELFSFSNWLFVHSLLVFGATRLAHFVVGRLHGPAALGLYTVGSEIAFLPTTELIAPINRATFPGYARMASNLAALRQSYLEVIAMINAVALPSSLGVAVIAEPLVRTLLGERWAEAATFVQVLAFTGAIHALTSNNHAVWLALGDTRTPVLVVAPYFLALISLIATFSRWFGVVGIAYAELSASVLGLIVSYVMVFRALQLSIAAWLAQLWRPLVAATAMAVAVMALLPELPGGGPSGAAWGLQLLVAVPAGAVIYTLVLALLWLLAGMPRGVESSILRHSAGLIPAKKQPEE